MRFAALKKEYEKKLEMWGAEMLGFDVRQKSTLTAGEVCTWDTKVEDFLTKRGLSK